MLVSVVPAALDDLARVRLVLFDGGIGEHANIVVDIKVEQRARLSSRLVDDKVVEAVVMGYDQVLLPAGEGRVSDG